MLFILKHMTIRQINNFITAPRNEGTKSVLSLNYYFNFSAQAVCLFNTIIRDKSLMYYLQGETTQKQTKQTKHQMRNSLLKIGILKRRHSCFVSEERCFQIIKNIIKIVMPFQQQMSHEKPCSVKCLTKHSLEDR